MFEDIVTFIQKTYQTDKFIPLHEPIFSGREKELVVDCINSTFVSSVGEYVGKFEKLICEFTGSKYAVAVVNGTAALHLALVVAGVESDDEVISQALTFVATANAIKYCGAHPIFLDSALDNLGLCPVALEQFLNDFAEIKDDGLCYNKKTGRRIKACVPMHVFGMPVKLDEIIEICRRFNIELIEDCAESLGSYYKKAHTGIKSKMSILSFNGNKIITCGGGGIVLAQDEETAKRLKHLSTTAKLNHPYEFVHDEVGFNYRMPNLNAALGCGQLESLDFLIEQKRKLYKHYLDFFSTIKVKILNEVENSESNFWLNAIFLKDREQRDAFLKYSNSCGVMTRPVWKLIPTLKSFESDYRDNLLNAKRYEDIVVNIPSSANHKL